ncbi:hypothetical protein D3C83_108660 [compost metagenome]
MTKTYSALASRLQKTSAGGQAISSSDATAATHRDAIRSSSAKFNATYAAKHASVTLFSAVTLEPKTANTPAAA